MQMVVEVRAERALRTLDNLAAAINTRTATTALLSGAQLIVNDARARAPRLTGNLARSIHAEPVAASGALAAVKVGTNVVYARIHEYGGTIVPKSGKYLVFPGRDGKLVFARSVTIPARPYLRPAFEAHKYAAVQEAGEVIVMMLKQAAA